MGQQCKSGVATRVHTQSEAFECNLKRQAACWVCAALPLSYHGAPTHFSVRAGRGGSADADGGDFLNAVQQGALPGLAQAAGGSAHSWDRS